MANRAFDPFVTYFNASVAPAAGHKFYFYTVGTNTLKTIYSDATGLTPIDNPVIVLNSGQLPEVFIDGAYKIIWKDKNDKQIKEVPSFGGNVESQLDLYSATKLYNTGDLATGSNGYRYQSLIDNNTGNDPTISPTAWVKVQFIITWNALYTFSVNDLAQGSNGLTYVSLITPNLNNDPATDDGTKWAPAASPYNTGDVIFSADSTKYQAPEWLPSKGDSFLSATYPLLAAIIGQWYSKLADPATLPAGTMTAFGGSVPWTTDDVYAAVPHATTPFVTIYKRTVDTFTKLANPATLPTGTGNGADFDGTDTYLAVGHNTTPFVTIYSRSGDVFTKLANPATLPTGSGRGIKFDSTTAHLAVGHNTSPFITVYAITAGPTFTKLANPATLPSDTVNAVAWASDSSYLAVACSTTSVLVIYSLSGSTLTKVTDPATLPSANGVGVSFDPTDTYLAFASTSSPYLLVYKNTAGTFEKLPDGNFSDLPAVSLRDVYFDSDGFLFCVTDNAIIRYKREGDTFTQIGSEFVTSDDVGTNVTVSKSGTKTYAAIGGTVSPFVAFYKNDTYITPDIDVDNNDIVKAYIKTGA